MGNFLEHIEKKSIINILKLCHQALIINGKLIIIVPNQANPLSIGVCYSDFTHEVGFTLLSLFQVLKIVGFQKILIQPYRRDLVRYKWLKKLIYRYLTNFFRISTEYEFFFSKKIYSISKKLDESLKKVKVNNKKNNAR